MISDSIQKKLLDKILSSKEFSSSKIYESYLTYLIEATKEGKSLKETTIAIDVFGKDANFNPAEDTIVRSHAYTLRKKLQSYYYDEGKDDKFRLRIPKGHYEATFVPISKDYFLSKNVLIRLAKNYYIFIILIAGLCILLASLWSHNRTVEKELQNYQIISKDNPIWREYLQPELPVMIVLGNHFFFNKYSDRYQYEIGIRHGKINSIEDLEVFKSQYPDDTIKPTYEPYFPYHSIWSLPPILSILFSVNQKPILRKSSTIIPQILNEYNIIFLGSIKTLYILKHTLSKSHFSFEILPHKITYSSSDTTSVQIFETGLHSAGPNEDLVLALKLPGPANNSIFIIASYHSLGSPEIANYLTNTSTRMDLEKRFKEKYDKVPQYFEILFRVTGIDKTAYSTEVLIYNEITKD